MFSRVIKGGIYLKWVDSPAVAGESIRTFNYIPVGKYVFKGNNKDTGIAFFESLMLFQFTSCAQGLVSLLRNLYKYYSIGIVTTKQAFTGLKLTVKTELYMKFVQVRQRRHAVVFTVNFE